MHRRDLDKGAGRRGRGGRLIGLALTTALAGAALTGCASSSTPHAAQSASKAEAAMAKGRYDSAIAHAEAAVLADPANAAYRATLGAAYLDAGRFVSAAAAFDDALTLGDASPQTALSLALALSADGRDAEALKVLGRWQGAIAPSDLGLAFALAGQPQRGVMILTEALRGGENTAKVRQNLAYSYALAGQWREARLMAAEDVPADQLGDRIAEWAQQAHPQAYRQRIAALLSVPGMAKDPGQPVELALGGAPVANGFAGNEPAATPAMALASPAPAQPAPAPADQELPPIGDAGDASFMPAAYTPPPMQAPLVAAAAPRPSRAPAPAPAQPAKAAAPRSAAVANGTHLVQLGSFSSEQGARRAWGIYAKRYPELANHRMVLSQAVIGGRTYWRVAAAGFDANGSRAMCGRINGASREGCIAYAEGRPLPGAIEPNRRLASR